MCRNANFGERSAGSQLRMSCRPNQVFITVRFPSNIRTPFSDLKEFRKIKSFRETMNEFINLHETWANVDVLKDHHYDRIYDCFHSLFGNYKNINLCLILSIENFLNQENQNQNNLYQINPNKRVHCQFENDLFTVDL